MKTFIRIFALTFILTSCSVTFTEPAYTQSVGVSFQVFYDQLSPYGEWVDYPAYGYVWLPEAGPDFFPYMTDGYWIYTGFGWTWVSDYPWGWAPFHYGRWDFDQALGWFWVPDYTWGPSWVTWRRADGYFGWAPMRPGIGVRASFRSGYRDPDRWVFVRDRDFTDHDISRRLVNRGDYNNLIGRSSVISNTFTNNRRNATYVAGPQLNIVQRATGRRINVVSVTDNSRPGERFTGDRLQIYRPRIDRINGGREQPAPARVADIRSIRPSRQSHMVSPGNHVTERLNPAIPQSRTERGQRSAPALPERRQAQPRAVQPQRVEPVPSQQQERPGRINPGRVEQRAASPARVEPAPSRVQQERPGGINPGRGEQHMASRVEPRLAPSPSFSRRGNESHYAPPAARYQRSGNSRSDRRRR
ncbi:MAG: DUF6600 domain-containing protein [Bacteroidales bacterium]